MELTKDIEVDGVTYTVGKLTGRAGIRALHKVAAAIGPTASLLIDQGLQGKKLAEVDVEKLLHVLGTEALPRLFTDLSEQKLDALIDTFFATITTVRESKKVEVLRAFDLVFQGNSLSALKLLAHAVWFNFEDFSGGSLEGLLRRLPKMGKAGSSEGEDSQKTS